MTIAGEFTAHVKETVTIIRPMPSVIPRGPASSREQQPTRSIRMQPHVLEAIDEAAAYLNMSRSAFMSWCGYYVALDIIQQHKEYMKGR